MSVLQALPVAGAGRRELIELLAQLYRAQLEQHHEGYIANHSGNVAVIGRHVDAFLRYRAYVGPGRVLDWGCRHAADSCLLRASFGPGIELHGCDRRPARYPVFHDYAGLSFAALKHRWRLPYSRDSFDCVIGSGVLEHVPNDSESLKELHRVLKSAGRLILTFLPNRWSISELLSRATGRSHHLRLYGRGEIRRMLLHHGFEPRLVRYHQMLPTLAGRAAGAPAGPVLTRAVESAFRFNAALERVWLLKRLAANLLVVACKRRSM